MPQPYSTLQNIYTKVRRLTRSPSTAQLSDDDINNYVNEFLLFDLPEHLRLFDLRQVFSFYTTPLVGDYYTNTTDVNSPFYQFKNRYISVHEPMYIAGYKRFYTQSRDQFFGLYPQIESMVALPQLGDGINQTFTGTLLVAPIIRGQFQLTSVDATGLGLIKVDVPYPPGSPYFPTLGAMVTPNTPPPAVLDPLNSINYFTNQFSVVFPTAPMAGKQIWTQSVPTAAALPQAVLYYDDIFTVRPIPDNVYKIEFEVYRRPTELLSTNLAQTPEIHQWAQFVAYGASRKCFQDRMDMESIQMIEPEYRMQMNLVNRKTIVQLTNERTATIFTEGNANWPYGGWGFFGTSQS